MNALHEIVEDAIEQNFHIGHNFTVEVV